MLAQSHPPSTDRETRRLAALHALELLDSEPESEYDAIVALASRLLDKPVAFLSLVDRDRQWLKARHNIAARESPRSIAFCNHTIRGTDLLVVADATRDRRFRDNPLVTTDGGVRFYAGMPLHVVGPDGERHAIGALCVADRAPGEMPEAHRAALRHLAMLVEALLGARVTIRRQRDEIAYRDRAFGQAERMARIGSWRLEAGADRVEWSDGVFAIYGLPNDRAPSVDDALSHYPPPARAIVADAIGTALRTGDPFQFEVDFVARDGDVRRVRAIGESEIVDGAVVAILGVFQDITDRYRTEQRLRRSANVDDLTGIANRAAFNRALKAAIAAPGRNDTPLMLALIDLDGFKAVNDTLGHLAGDDVLRAVGGRLRAPWLHGSFAARLGGDEFALIVDHPSLTAQPDRFVERLQEELCVPVTAGKLTITVAGTVGTALLDASHDGLRDFVHAADTCLYAAKRRRIGNRRRNAATIAASRN